MALGIEPGDEIITTPYSYIATVEVIVRLGAKPVFADIKKDSFNIDIDQIQSKLTSKTKAILPVSLFGQPANIPAIKELASGYGASCGRGCKRKVLAAQ